MHDNNVYLEHVNNAIDLFLGAQLKRNSDQMNYYHFIQIRRHTIQITLELNWKMEIYLQECFLPCPMSLYCLSIDF